jgi:alpha-L-glutamate ligase-like protein
VIARLGRLRREVLGLNRRNHGYLFAYNSPRHYALVDDKRATKVALAVHGVAAPALQHVCDTQWEVRRLGERLGAATDFVLKPARGAGGAGIVVVVERRGARFVKASGRTLGRRDLEAHACDVLAGVYSARGADDALLVEERVIAEPTLGRLAYRGVPDVRVLVFRGVPVLAMLRLPTRHSDGRANLHLGGVGVGVDLASGRTTFAVRGRLGRRPLTVHPDLGCSLTGVTVPLWQDVLHVAVRAADAVDLGFVGVDVVLDVRHGPLILELNARPGLSIQLANRRGLRPLLDAVAALTPPAAPGDRVALGQGLSPGARGDS